MTHGKNWRSAVAAAATAALMLSATPMAMADTDKVVSGLSVDASKINVGAIDPAKTIDLTLVKKGNDGTTAVAGVTFKVQRLAGYDLLTQESWEKALKLTPAEAAQGPFVGEPLEVTTGADGSAQLTGLERGLYYVEEISTNGDVVSSAPFVITLPSGNKDGSEWSYNLTVTAKNQPVPTTPPTVPPTTPVPIPIPIPIPIPNVSTATVTPPPATVTPTATPTPAPPAPAEKGIPRKVQQALASTGASVIGVVIAGALLVVAGIFLVGRRRKSEEA
ncbi:hypothetical protein C1Y63_04415 [Corynebacterium sp. 13CS0277]|uniref:SpaH/EbpB family LPXTG-anchored major pilin n=1 Tax=Corynebacterium sp. 13CS0277 TaxID=2071994 RepID=UPI000D03B20A|nr:SpaH/EbpB family LPXTG-anchored major pilin [Corynebacterium sp. 13CS0277]PRQ11660.1 hypothetical protein C1Y63_04415 [Corynebacterium sp. 13CS0277]